MNQTTTMKPPEPTPYKTTMLTFRAEPTLRDLLDRLSKRGHRSRSDYIRETLARAASTR